MREVTPATAAAAGLQRGEGSREEPGERRGSGGGR